MAQSRDQRLGGVIPVCVSLSKSSHCAVRFVKFLRLKSEMVFGFECCCISFDLGLRLTLLLVCKAAPLKLNELACAGLPSQTESLLSISTK